MSNRRIEFKLQVVVARPRKLKFELYTPLVNALSVLLSVWDGSLAF